MLCNLIPRFLNKQFLPIPPHPPRRPCRLFLHLHKLSRSRRRRAGPGSSCPGLPLLLCLWWLPTSRWFPGTLPGPLSPRTQPRRGFSWTHPWSLFLSLHLYWPKWGSHLLPALDFPKASEEMATCSSILLWRISWTEEPGGLQSMELQRIGHDRTTKLS